MERLGLPVVAGARLPEPTLIQQEEVQAMQECAAALAKLQMAQEKSRAVIVGYNRNTSASAFSWKSSPEGNNVPVPHAPIYVPVTFNPYSRPVFPDNPEVGADVLRRTGVIRALTSYDEVKAKYDAASEQITRIVTLYPSLYAVTRDAKSEQTAAFAEKSDFADARATRGGNARADH